MKLKDIKENFNPTEMIVIKRFLQFVNETALTDSDFADESDIDTLNQFSDLAETDDEIKASVKDYLRLKKVRLRGNQTSN